MLVTFAPKRFGAKPFCWNLQYAERENVMNRAMEKQAL
jgi:hypothetical protein